MYASDNNGYSLPGYHVIPPKHRGPPLWPSPAPTWGLYRLKDYLNPAISYSEDDIKLEGVYHCPASEATKDSPGFSTLNPNRRFPNIYCSYGLNENVSRSMYDGYPPKLYKLTDIVYVADGGWTWRYPFTAMHGHRIFFHRHSGKTNGLFGGGHVKSLSRDQFDADMCSP